MMDYIAAHAGLIGLLLFFSVFVVVFCWTFYPGRKEEVESHKYMLFSEGLSDGHK